MAKRIQAELDAEAAAPAGGPPHQPAGTGAAAANPSPPPRAGLSTEAARYANSILRLRQFVPGSRVRVVGLPHHPDLDGKEGRCIGHLLDDEDDDEGEDGSGSGAGECRPTVAVLFEDRLASTSDDQEQDALLFSPRNLVRVKAPPIPMRVDPSDGALYTEAEFLSFYGQEGPQRWEAAERYDHHAAITKLYEAVLRGEGPQQQQSPGKSRRAPLDPSRASAVAQAVITHRIEKEEDGTTFFRIVAAADPADGCAPWQVWRRYSDFSQLRDSLKACGVVADGFPSKKLFRVKGEALDERQSALTAWLKEMVRLSHDGGRPAEGARTLLLAFCRPRDTYQWDTTPPSPSTWRTKTGAAPEPTTA